MKNTRTAKFNALLALLTLSVSLAGAASAHADFYNLGTLDVKPIHTNDPQNPAKNKDWFIEYLKPGESKQQMIQIANFAPETKYLKLYVTDTTANNKNEFFVKKIEDQPDYLKEWVHLPVNELTLGPGESRILSTNFTLPDNAGIGLHEGAIIVREIRHNEDNPAETIAFEKGVRIYLNVTGPAITQGHITSMAPASTLTNYGLKINTANTGTTDYIQTYGLELRSLMGVGNQHIQAESLTKPQTTTTTNVNIQKPAFGLYQVYLTTPQHEIAISTVLFIPFWLPLAAAALAVALGYARQTQVKGSERTARARVGRLCRTMSLQTTSLQNSQTFAYLGLFAIIATATFTAPALTHIAKSQLFIDEIPLTQAQNNEPAASYELTIKWGNFRNITIPKYYTKTWNGSIQTPNAQIGIQELLNYERTDEAQITAGRSELLFNQITGPDNDGIVLRIEPTNNEIPIIRYINTENDVTYEFPITDFLKSPGIFPDGLFSTYIKAELGKEDQLRQQAIEAATLRDLGESTESIEELDSTPSIGQIPELENLFLEEIPTSREQLSEFILTSNYVEKIVEENEVQQIETDNILIQALSASKEVLEEIANTQSLNFIFLPTETINFPAQAFSFDEERIANVELGTLIFVQNKDSVWNTFVATTDFDLLSGGFKIPASSLTIIPGEATKLGEEDGSEIRTGFIKRLAGDQDKAQLVSVIPNQVSEALPSSETPEDSVEGEIPQEEESQSLEVFVLNPRLEISIPRGTPAGTYRGTLTITSL